MTQQQLMQLQAQIARQLRQFDEQVEPEPQQVEPQPPQQHRVRVEPWIDFPSIRSDEAGVWKASDAADVTGLDLSYQNQQGGRGEY